MQQKNELTVNSDIESVFFRENFASWFDFHSLSEEKYCFGTNGGKYIHFNIKNT